MIQLTDKIIFRVRLYVATEAAVADSACASCSLFQHATYPLLSDGVHGNRNATKTRITRKFVHYRFIGKLINVDARL